MPAWQIALIVAALVAAAFVVAIGLRLSRDPYMLVRAEFARERIALGFARRVVEVDGIRWVWAEGGSRDPDAPVLVMLHGYTGSKENWYPVARRLRGRCRLLIPDLPGWGESQREGVAGHGFAAQAARVAAFIRATCDRPVTVLGHSMGGGVAAVLAAREPRLVARVGLFDAAGVRFADNQFGLEVLAGNNPFGVHDREVRGALGEDRGVHEAKRGLLDRAPADAVAAEVLAEQTAVAHVDAPDRVVLDGPARDDEGVGRAAHRHEQGDEGDRHRGGGNETTNSCHGPPNPPGRPGLRSE